MSADVELDRITISFGSFRAVEDVSFRIESGEFFSILGPSGCGKTTLLRTISGFLHPSSGAVRIGGQDMAGIEPNKRPTALIFQNLALFPLMSVAENVAYGLKVRGIDRATREKRAAELLALVALPDQGAKRISELSGGQKQRVAIARALAVEPKVLLLDEPLSALDLRLRQHMRNELRAIQKRVGITFVYITHDQGEALTMSDRIAVMNAGHVEQIGTGRSIYNDPATPFVASFVGENNAFSGTFIGREGEAGLVETPFGRLPGRLSATQPAVGTPATLFVRPEALRLARSGEPPRLSARLKTMAFEGNLTHLYCAGPAGEPIAVTAGPRDDTAGLAQGVEIGLSYDWKDGLVLPVSKSQTPR